MVRGNQCIARECYSASMKQKMVDNIYVDELDMWEEVSTRLEPLEELELEQLGDQPEHHVYIGSKLVEDIKSPSHPFSKADHGGIFLETGRHGRNRLGSDHP